MSVNADGVNDLERHYLFAALSDKQREELLAHTRMRELKAGQRLFSQNDSAPAANRAAGLGASGSGVEHWRAQRLSALAAVPLSVWFLASLIALAGGDYAVVTAWLSRPVVTILMVVLLATLFWHLALGLRVIIEDYVHAYLVKIAAVGAVEVVCFLLATTGIYATLAVAFGT